MIVEKDGIRGKIESLLAQENSPSIYIEWDDGTISFPYHADCISIQLISPN
jgi:hypothetical protein